MPNNILNTDICIVLIFPTLFRVLQVEAEVGECIEEWEKQNNKVFRVGGVQFMDFIKNQWQDYKVVKENEKEQRVRILCAPEELSP